MPDVVGSIDVPALLQTTRRLHEDIRARVGALLERARAGGRPELASAPGDWAAGDLTYALDDEAEAALDRFGREVAERHPLTLVAEGPGVTCHGERAPGPPLRAIVDPVDGTRSLMLDVRSAWALTGIAPDKGAATRLSDCVVAVQTELPTTFAGVYHVLTAVRGQGATIARHDVRTGAEIERRPLLADTSLRIDNGYLCFARYLPVERTLVAELERRFLERIVPAFDLSPRLIYDDQYLCSAGQLYLVATGRYRMLADLRGWLRRTRGLENFTSKPYDLAALLIYREAGVPVLGADLAPLDAPLDTETPLSVLAFANESLRERLAPHLAAVMAGP
jgi:fructose-1,6-bisphosphatase/inositol monophosphatase family enzyme